MSVRLSRRREIKRRKLVYCLIFLFSSFSRLSVKHGNSALKRRHIELLVVVFLLTSSVLEEGFEMTCENRRTTTSEREENSTDAHIYCYSLDCVAILSFVYTTSFRKFYKITNVFCEGRRHTV